MRLTKEIKQQIVRTAVKKSGLADKANELMNIRADIAEKLRRVFISETLEQHVDSMCDELMKMCDNKSQLNFTITTSWRDYINIETGGAKLTLAFSGQFSTTMGEQIGNRTPIYKTVNRHGWAYSVTDDLGAMKNTEELTELNKRIHDLVTSVNAILGKCSTKSQLLKLWPESVELIPEDVKPKTTELMVQTKDLNSLLGLTK